MFVHGQKIENCAHCERIAKAELGELETLIWSRQHSIAIVGEHQFFPGYCVAVSKHHIREMHDLPDEVSASMFREVLELGRAVDAAYKPWKVNYASFGNVDEHLHWHVIPRYDTDFDMRDHPWKNAAKFPQYKTSDDDARRVKDLIISAKAKL